MKRGQIYWCDLEPRRGREQGERRPAVIISADLYNATASPLIGIIPLTSAAPKTPLHLPLEPADSGLAKSSTALVDHLRFVDRERLSNQPIGMLSVPAVALLERNLRRLLQLN